MAGTYVAPAGIVADEETARHNRERSSVTDDRTMDGAAAQRYMEELAARAVPYSFQPLARGLVTVTTSGVGREMWGAYDALVATWVDCVSETGLRPVHGG